MWILYICLNELLLKKNIFVQIVLNMSISIFVLQGIRILFKCSAARACFSWKPTDCLKGLRVLKHKFQSVGKGYTLSWSVRSLLGLKCVCHVIIEVLPPDAIDKQTFSAIKDRHKT